MKTSDKELDDLFSSKLNNLETEPDTVVWENISAQLNGRPKKKNILQVLSIAASLIVVLSVGLLLLRQNDQPVKNQLPHKVVKLKVERDKPEIKPVEILTEKKMLLSAVKNKAVKEARTFKKNSRRTVLKPMVNPSPQEYPIQTLARAKSGPDHNFDPANDQVEPSKIAVVPNAATKLKVPMEVETPEAIAAKPTIPTAKASKPTFAAKRKSIRSMGDLVNLVMAKVDKRQDKLIEFTDNDDGDESNITGINLGIISIKKEK